MNSVRKIELTLSPDPKTGLKQLVRFRMSSNEETVLCKDLDSLCEVRDLVHSGRYLAVLVSSDSESRIFIIQVGGNCCFAEFSTLKCCN